jgi:tol-pal system protein YbgF
MRRARRGAGAFLGLGLLLCAPGVGAQGSSPVVTQHQLQVVETRLERVERLMDSGVLTDMLQRIDALQTEVRMLRGQVDQLDHDLQNLQTRQRDQFRTLDERLTRLEGGALQGQAAAPGPPSAGVEALPAADEQEAYQAAFDRLMSGDHEAAIQQLEAFMDRFSDGIYAPNALYWLAEARYARGDYEGALAGFQVVQERFPDSDKAADALLKTGYAHFELGNAEAARVVLRQVVAEHPGTTLARLAQDRLRRLEGR